MLPDIETKLSAARTQLILDKPFLGALVLRLPLVEGDSSWCKSTFTDMKKLYYNAEFIAQLKPLETQFVLAHEALHCALSHFARRQHRVRHRWDLACDYAINPILVREGLTPPPNIMLMWDYEGMSAEEIYPLLSDNENDAQNELGQDNSEGEQEQGEESDQGEGKNTESQKLTSQQQDDGRQSKGQTAEQGKQTPDGKQEQPPPELNNDEVQSLTAQWQQRMAGAAQQAMQAGKLSQAMLRLVDHLLQPQLPWRMLLARYMTATAKEDYNYSRPSSRRGEPAIFPRLRSNQVNVIAAIDVSGSITTSELKEFLSEINQIKAQIRARVSLIACDARIDPDGPWEYEPWEEFALPKTFSGGGGTDFNPVFEWISTQDLIPDLLVYFTDAEGSFPEQQPNFPVIWLVKGRLPVPWGQRVQLN